MEERTVRTYSSSDKLLDALRKSPLDPNTKARDWELINCDNDSTKPQSLADEFDRLLVLKSYNVLDSEPEIEFDETTRQAKQLFDVPIAVVSLVDIGRQWFKSIQGLDASQTPRSCAFCAHVILRRDDVDEVMVVPDTTKDVRFKDNPLVAGGPKVRFYAGAPLISPEGPKLGTFCIIDMKPRPAGLTKHEKQILLQLANETVYNMIIRGDDCEPTSK